MCKMKKKRKMKRMKKKKNELIRNGVSHVESMKMRTEDCMKFMKDEVTVNKSEHERTRRLYKEDKTKKKKKEKKKFS